MDPRMRALQALQAKNGRFPQAQVGTGPFKPGPGQMAPGPKPPPPPEVIASTDDAPDLGEHQSVLDEALGTIDRAGGQFDPSAEADRIMADPAMRQLENIPALEEMRRRGPGR